MIRLIRLLILLLAFSGTDSISNATHLPQSLTLSGTVRNETGAPVANAEVEIRVSGDLISRTTTDANGAFTVVGLSRSEGTISFRAAGYADLTKRWTAKPGENATIDIVLLPSNPSGEVTITATASATRIADTAASVAVLSRDELATTAAGSIDDALKQVAGFQLFRRVGSRTANPTTQGVSLRGTGASGASRAVVLVDGVPLNDPFGGWVHWGRVPSLSVDRIEVLRGGASDIYGGGALGGAIQLFSRKPQSNTLSFEGSLSNERSPFCSLFTSVFKDRWGILLSAETFRTDGYILVPENERGRVDTLAGSKHDTLVLTLQRQFGESGRAFLKGSLFKESRTNGTPLQTNDTHIRQLAGGGDWESPSAGAFSLRFYGGTQVFDQNFSAISADRNSESLTRSQRSPSQSVGFNGHWSRAIPARNTLVAGIDGREVRGSGDEIAFAQGRATALIGAGGRERTLGIFLEDIFHPIQHLYLTAAIRFDHWRDYRASTATRLLVQNGTTTTTAFADRTESAASPQFSALFKLNQRFSITGSAYRAFRQPTLNELYRAFRAGNVLTLANENLHAERLGGAEAGIVFVPESGRFNARGTFFWSEINLPVANVTLSSTPALITRQRQNLGRTRSRGLELEAEDRLGRHWAVSGGYLYTQSTVLKFSVNPALEGLRIPQVPRHVATFQLTYRDPRIATIGVQTRLVGMQFDDDQNLFPLARFFTVDLIASHSLRHGLDLFAAAENLFNSRYQIGRTPVTTVGPPLLVRVGVRLNLGGR